jgi:hypothetical protein
MGTGKKPTNARNFIIKPEGVDEFFQDRGGQRHRGTMVAFDKDGNEVARGATYADFMANLRALEERTGCE